MPFLPSRIFAQIYSSVQGQMAYYGDQNSGIVVAATESSGEWSEHVDDQGYTYYYSSVKGESQYEYPYS